MSKSILSAIFTSSVCNDVVRPCTVKSPVTVKSVNDKLATVSVPSTSRSLNVTSEVVLTSCPMLILPLA